MTLKGHEVTLIKTSKAMHDDNYKFMTQNNNELTVWEDGNTIKVNLNQVTDDLPKIAGAEIVMIFTQTNYHEQLIKRAAKYALKMGRR